MHPLTVKVKTVPSYCTYPSDYNIHPLNSENQVCVLSGLSENKVTDTFFYQYKDTKEQRVTEGKSQESENGLMEGRKFYKGATVVGSNSGQKTD